MNFNIHVNDGIVVRVYSADIQIWILCFWNSCEAERIFGHLACMQCSLSGTRYRRRGVDALGNVANFVETEMVVTILQYAHGGWGEVKVMAFIMSNYTNMASPTWQTCTECSMIMVSSYIACHARLALSSMCTQIYIPGSTCTYC